MFIKNLILAFFALLLALFISCGGGGSTKTVTVMTYTVTVSTETGVAPVDPSTFTVAEGGYISFPVSALDGYHNLVPASSTVPVTISNGIVRAGPVSRHSVVTVTAEKIPDYAISVIAEAGIQPFADSVIYVREGTTYSLAFTVLPGYQNPVAEGTGVAVVINGSDVIIGPVSRHGSVRVRAEFIPIPVHQVTISTGEGIQPLSQTLFSIQEGNTLRVPFVVRSGYRNPYVQDSATARIENFDLVVGPVVGATSVFLDAVKIPASFTIRASAGVGGTITPTLSSVELGNALNLRATADPGYDIEKIVNQSKLNMFRVSGGDAVVSNVSEDDTIVATFVQKPPPSTSYILKNIRVTPHAIFADEFTSTSILVESELNPGTVTPFVQYTSTSGVIKHQMYDDGTHGDRNGGDGVYSAEFTMDTTPQLLYYNQMVGEIVLTVTGYNAQGNTVWPVGAKTNRFSILAIDRVKAVSPTFHASGLATTKNCMFSVRNDAHASTYSDLGFVWSLYDRFGDVFDGIHISYVGHVRPEKTIEHDLVKNDVQGIGLSAISRSAEYGSAGKLRIVFSTNEDALKLNFLRLVGNMWGFYLSNDVLKLSDSTGKYVRGPSTHLGQMGNGYNLMELPSGDFQVVQNAAGGFFPGNYYSELERYLGGFIPPEDVYGVRFVRSSYGGSLNLGSIIPAAETMVVRTSDLATVYGERVPHASMSQRDFSFGWCVVSSRPLLPAEYALSEWIAAYYAGTSEGREVLYPADGRQKAPPSFAAATRFAGTLKFVVPPQ